MAPTVDELADRLAVLERAVALADDVLPADVPILPPWWGYLSLDHHGYVQLRVEVQESAWRLTVMVAGAELFRRTWRYRVSDVQPGR